MSGRAGPGRTLAAVRWFRFPRALGIVIALYLVGMAVVFGMFSHQSVEFVKHAARTNGTVVELVARAPAGSTREPVTSARAVPQAPKVSYSVAGNIYTYTAAHGRYHQRLKIGDQVQVLYNPADPAEARLKGEGTVLVPGITVTFALTALLVVVILIRTRNLGAVSGESRRQRRAPVPIDAGPPRPS
jgi:hypothetical protein